MCVISGVVAGVISMAVLLHTDTPRSTPMPLADMPLATSVASPRTVSLQQTAALPSEADLRHNATVMFDNARPEATPRIEGDISSSAIGVTLPIGETVTVTCSTGFDRVRGKLEAADADWLQVVNSAGKRVWVAKQQVISISTEDATALTHH